MATAATRSRKRSIAAKIYAALVNLYTKKNKKNAYELCLSAYLSLIQPMWSNKKTGNSYYNNLQTLYSSKVPVNPSTKNRKKKKTFE